MKRLAIASFAVGAVLAAFFIILIVRSAPSAPQPVGGGLVHLSDDGMKIYASRPDALPACEVKTTAATDVPLRAGGSERIGINGVNWYLVAQSVEVVPAGDYVVSCVDAEPDTTYAVAPKSSIVLFVVSILGLVFSLLIFVILGVVLLVVGSRRKRTNGGGYQPPGYYNPGPNPDRPQDH